MKKLFFFLLLPLIAMAQEEETPEQIEVQLDSDEKLYNQAKGIFNPWYAGPLLTGGAHMMPPGSIGLQPYLFVTDNYAVYDNKWHSVNVTDLLQVQPQINAIQAGVTDWLDVNLTLAGSFNWEGGAYESGFGDMSFGIGLPLLKEGIGSPALKVGIQETFPTGKYNDLDPAKNGTDILGEGSYQTALSLRIAKLTFWKTKHPLNLRATFTYTIPTMVRIKNYNAYGGGDGARGRVRPGNQFNLSMGMEFSFTEEWVFANDVVWIHNNKTKFSGNPGTINGVRSIIGTKATEQFSLAPALEFNPTPNLNFLAGVWFTFAGRNSTKFLSGIVSMAYTFSVN